MKTRKIINISVLLLFLLTTLLWGCAQGSGEDTSVPDGTSDTASVADSKKPKIRIFDSYKVFIKKGESFDLMSGVKGSDDVDGDITDKIQINDGGFDPQVPGEYTVVYFLSDSAGNVADPKQRTITVKETDVLAAPPVWEGSIEGEVLDPADPPVFGGAWYYKAVSSKDAWVGIEATVTLPQVDLNRYDGEYDTSLDVDPDAKNLDNPSVYLGGHAQNESDVGLSFSRALVDVDSKTLSKGCIAFRPFWRYITATDQDAGGYEEHGGEYAVSANGNNCIANYHWKYTEYYYLPGDKLRILVFSPEANKLQLQIQVLEVSTLPESVKMREEYGWKAPEDFLSPVFASPGHGTGSLAEFKRVNALDQTGNEGGTAIPTESVMKSIVWHETYLYRVLEGTMYRVPMGENRRGTTGAPSAEHFSVSYEGVDTSKGGEVVTIHPGYTN